MDTAAFVTNVITDPSILVGIPAMKLAERGIRKNLLSGNTAGKNAWQNGVEEFLGKSNVSPQESAKLIEAAKMADKGDKQGINLITDAFEQSGDLKGQLKAVEDKEIKEISDKLVGNGEGVSFDIKSVGPADPKTLNVNVKPEGASINLNRIQSQTDAEELFEVMGNHFKEEFARLVPKKGLSQVEQEAQLHMLSDLVGKKVTNMEVDEAYALRQMFASSGEQAREALLNYRKDPLKSDETFSDVVKSLTLLKVLTAKVTGLEAHAGRLLNVQKVAQKPSRESIDQVKQFLSDLRNDPSLGEDKLEMLAE